MLWKGNCFNPRPPWRTGDAQIEGMRELQEQLFQSAPALEDGRCMVTKVVFIKEISFNPRPPWRTGDALLLYI